MAAEPDGDELPAMVLDPHPVKTMPNARAAIPVT
jgi:hypothetical protein